jgi:hypothetical protein
MKALLLAAVLIAAPVVAQQDTAALVDAAKQTNRKKSTRKVITNADVKKSKAKGRVTEMPTLPAIQTIDQTTQEKYDAARRTREQVRLRVEAAEKKVAGLESELAAIEASYFDENDPNVRDTAVVRRFETTKKLLEAAQQELTEARAAKPRDSQITELPTQE